MTTEQHGLLRQLALRDMAWADHAACRNADPQLFFPDKEDAHGPATYTAALAYCEVCPVCQECLTYAVTNFSRQDDWGVWGGKTPSQRHKIRQKWLKNAV